LDEADIALLKSYGLGPYNVRIKALEEEIKKLQSTTHDLIGIPESDTGLAPPSMWDLVGDKQMMSEEAPLQVARCTKIITDNDAPLETADASAMSSHAPVPQQQPGQQAAAAAAEGKQKYVINVKQIAKFVVDLGEKVSPTDIEEGMRVGVQIFHSNSIATQN
jgi:26S proteasome regulatory subunit T1